LLIAYYYCHFAAGCAVFEGHFRYYFTISFTPSRRHCFRRHFRWLLFSSLMARCRDIIFADYAAITLAAAYTHA
jgi:hypothetical protein